MTTRCSSPLDLRHNDGGLRFTVPPQIKCGENKTPAWKQGKRRVEPNEAVEVNSERKSNPLSPLKKKKKKLKPGRKGGGVNKEWKTQAEKHNVLLWLTIIGRSGTQVVWNAALLLQHSAADETIKTHARPLFFPFTSAELLRHEIIKRSVGCKCPVGSALLWLASVFMLLQMSLKK